jgi:hypothetical protein
MAIASERHTLLDLLGAQDDYVGALRIDDIPLGTQRAVGQGQHQHSAQASDVRLDEADMR